jgi:hypothetical protein
MALMSLGLTMYEAAQVPLMEKAICVQYYQGDSTATPDCKVKEIQKTLASVSGGLQFCFAALGRFAWRC